MIFCKTELTKQVLPKFVKPLIPGILDRVGSNVRRPRCMWEEVEAEEAEARGFLFRVPLDRGLGLYTSELLLLPLPPPGKGEGVRVVVAAVAVDAPLGVSTLLEGGRRGRVCRARGCLLWVGAGSGVVVFCPAHVLRTICGRQNTPHSSEHSNI